LRGNYRFTTTYVHRSRHLDGVYSKLAAGKRAIPSTLAAPKVNQVAS